jgi:hypothetical protein
LTATKYALVPEKRGDLANVAVFGKGSDKRAANALLAFEAFGGAQENNSYDFAETKRYAQAAMSPDTNDWITVWAEFVYLAACNMQKNPDREKNLAGAKSLLKKVSPAVWETQGNPIYRIYQGEGKLTADRICELVSGFITGNYCSLHKFDDAEAFLSARPDSRWKRDAATNIRSQRQSYMLSREEAERSQKRKVNVKEEAE